MNKVLEKMDSLFNVERKELTYKKGFFMLALILLAGFSIPLYSKYEDYKYSQYKPEYNSVVEIVESYKNQEGEYPIGSKVNLNKEKDLSKFFTENSLSWGNELYYIDTSLIDELEKTKYTYIVDIDKEKIYTSEFVVYKFRRWHFAFY